jgi:glycosyltransferase involved in cell wall biosynthesis
MPGPASKGAIRLLERNNAFLERLERLVARERDDEESIRLSGVAGRFASQHHPGRFASGAIERRLRAIAESQESPRSERFTAGSSLHVLTRAYPFGGHTRAVERWIGLSLEGERHSVALIDQKGGAVPPRLLEAVKSRQGTVFDLGSQSKSAVERALHLRRFASPFQHVILHTHMQDPIPVVAFGTRQFHRPVALYNHADHIFWLGLSVTDHVIDISSRGQLLTNTRRGRRSSMLPLILEIPKVPSSGEKEICRGKMRERFGLPDSARIVLSVGSSHKYKPVEAGKGFLDIARKILAEEKDACIVVVGPSQQEKVWRQAFRESGARINAVGPVPRDELDEFYLGADVYLDPYPIGGGTAVLEAASFGLPVVAIDNGFTPFDSYKDMLVSIDAASARVRNFLCGALPDRKVLLEQHTPQAWKVNLPSLLRDIPKHHEIHDFDLPFQAGEYDLHLAALLSVQERFTLKRCYRMARRLKVGNRLKVLTVTASRGWAGPVLFPAALGLHHR